jgi:hypothetical protein
MHAQPFIDNQNVDRVAAEHGGRGIQAVDYFAEFQIRTRSEQHLQPFRCYWLRVANRDCLFRVYFRHLSVTALSFHPALRNKTGSNLIGEPHRCYSSSGAKRSHTIANNVDSIK